MNFRGKKGIYLVSLAVLIILAAVVFTPQNSTSLSIFQKTINSISGNAIFEAQATGTAITTCQAITMSGEYYLANDITTSATSDCISINIDGVTLDGDGKFIKLTTSGSSGAAIKIVGRKNTIIKNLIINGYGDGIYQQHSNYTTITDTNITTLAKKPIQFETSHFNFMDRLYIKAPGKSINLDRSNFNTLTNSNITSTSDNAVYSSGYSEYFTLSDSFIYSPVSGIFTTTSSPHATIQNSTIKSGSYAIQLQYTNYTRIENITVIPYSGSNAVLYLSSGSSHSYVNNISMIGQGSTSVIVTGTNNTLINLYLLRTINQNDVRGVEFSEGVSNHDNYLINSTISNYYKGISIKANNNFVSGVNVTGCSDGLNFGSQSSSNIVSNSLFENNDKAISFFESSSSNFNNTIKDSSFNSNNIAINIPFAYSSSVSPYDNQFINLVADNNTNFLYMTGSIGKTNYFNNSYINNSRGDAIILAANSTVFSNITIENTDNSFFDLHIGSNSEGNWFVDTPIRKYFFGDFSVAGLGYPYYYQFGSKLNFRKTGVGEIMFTQPIMGRGKNLSAYIQISENRVFVRHTKRELSRASANITLFNVPTDIPNPQILKNGYNCPDTNCTAFTDLNAGTVMFGVTGWSNYTIGEYREGYSPEAETDLFFDDCPLYMDIPNVIYEGVDDTQDYYDGHCIIAEADNVTAEGNSHTFDGVPNPPSALINSPYPQYAGAYSNGHDNVTIRNLSFTDFAYGALFVKTNNSFFFNATVNSSAEGIVLDRAINNSFYNLDIFSRLVNIHTFYSQNNSFSGINYFENYTIDTNNQIQASLFGMIILESSNGNIFSGISKEILYPSQRGFPSQLTLSNSNFNQFQSTNINYSYPLTNSFTYDYVIALFNLSNSDYNLINDTSAINSSLFLGLYNSDNNIISNVKTSNTKALVEGSGDGNILSNMEMKRSVKGVSLLGENNSILNTLIDDVNGVEKGVLLEGNNFTIINMSLTNFPTSSTFIFLASSSSNVDGLSLTNGPQDGFAVKGENNSINNLFIKDFPNGAGFTTADDVIKNSNISNSSIINVKGGINFNGYSISENNLFSNISLQRMNTWISSGYPNFNTFRNILFITGNGTIMTLNDFASESSFVADTSNLFIDTGVAYNHPSQNYLNITSANVTLYNIDSSGLINPAILRDGKYLCSETTTPTCTNFTPLTGDVIFNVSSWSNYSIGERPLILTVSFLPPTPPTGTQTSLTSFEENASINSLKPILSSRYIWDGNDYPLYNETLLLMYNFDKIEGENESYILDLSLYGNNATPLVFGQPICIPAPEKTGISTCLDIPDEYICTSFNYLGCTWNVDTYICEGDSPLSCNLLLDQNWCDSYTNGMCAWTPPVLSNATYTLNGKYNGAYQFDGNDFISLETGYPQDGALEPLTLGLWINTKGSSQTQTIFLAGYNSPYQNTFGAYLDSNNNLFFKADMSYEVLEGYPNFFTGYALENNTWVYLTFVYNGTTVSSYINGIKANSVEENLIISIPSISIGADTLLDTNGINFFNGKIDEVRLWNSAFTDEQVREFYFTNIKKINSTDWAFYANQSAFSTGTHTYQVCATNENGEGCTEQRDITFNNEIIELNHSICSNYACVSVPGSLIPGETPCSSDSQCLPTTHLACINLACTPVLSLGGETNSCSVDSDCELCKENLVINLNNLVSSFDTGEYILSSAKYSNGYIYVSSGNTLYQLDANNLSNQISNFTALDLIISSPLISNDYVYVGSLDNNLYQLNASNLSQLISIFTTQDKIRSSPSNSDGYIYVSSGNTLYQLDADNISQQISNYQTTYTFMYSSPLIVNGNLLIGSSGGLLELNSSDVSQLIATNPTPVSTTPVIDNGYIYIGSQDNNLYQLNASDINQLIATYQTQGQIISPPTISGGYLYLASQDGKIYQLNSHDITQFISSYDLNGQPSFSSPQVSEGYVYIGSSDNRTYQLSALNVSKFISYFETGAAVASSPLLANGYIYIGSQDHLIYQVNGSSEITLINCQCVGANCNGGGGGGGSCKDTVWTCVDWDKVSCIDGLKTRTCTSNCNNHQRTETQSCTVASGSTGHSGASIPVVTPVIEAAKKKPMYIAPIAIVGLFLLFYYTRKKRFSLQLIDPNNELGIFSNGVFNKQKALPLLMAVEKSFTPLALSQRSGKAADYIVEHGLVRLYLTPNEKRVVLNATFTKRKDARAFRNALKDNVYKSIGNKKDSSKIKFVEHKFHQSYIPLFREMKRVRESKKAVTKDMSKKGGINGI